MRIAPSVGVHSHSSTIVGLSVGLMLLVAGGDVQGRSDRQQAGAAKPAKTTKAARPRFAEYQIPAGTTLPVELRTRVSSNGSRRADAVEGRLLRTLTTPAGIALLPAGASVLGTVSEAEPAGNKRPGRLAFAFQAIQHPQTGSRAMITTSVLTFESQPPAKGNLFADVSLEKGADASVLLLAPIVVRLPTAN